MDWPGTTEGQSQGCPACKYRQCPSPSSRVPQRVEMSAVQAMALWATHVKVLENKIRQAANGQNARGVCPGWTYCGARQAVAQGWRGRWNPFRSPRDCPPPRRARRGFSWENVCSRLLSPARVSSPPPPPLPFYGLFPDKAPGLFSRSVCLPTWVSNQCIRRS